MNVRNSSLSAASLIPLCVRSLVIIGLFPVSGHTGILSVDFAYDDPRFKTEVKRYVDLANEPRFDNVGLLSIQGGLDCTATLIDQWVILTAAHCAGGFNKSKDNWFGLGPTIDKAKRRKHPVVNAYKSFLIKNVGSDIALMELQSPITDVAPASLYEKEDEVGKEGIIVGYGQTGTPVSGAIPGTNGTKRAGRNVITRIVARTESFTGTLFYPRRLEYEFDDPANKAKAVNMEYFQALGDSGGPFFVESGGKLKLAGIISQIRGRIKWDRGIKPERDIKPEYGATGQLTRVSQYVGWIRQELDKIKKYKRAATATRATSDTSSDSCKRELHQIQKGGEACGIGFREDGRVLVGGKVVSMFLQKSKSDLEVQGETLKIYPRSPNGRYALVQNGSDLGPQEAYLLDIKNKSAAYDPFVGGFPADWISWSPDSAYLVYTYPVEDEKWRLHITRTSDGKGWRADTTFDLGPKFLRWLDPRTFEISVFPCKPFDNDHFRCTAAAQRVQPPVERVVIGQDGPVISSTRERTGSGRSMVVVSDRLCAPAAAPVSEPKPKTEKPRPALEPGEGQGVLAGRIIDIFGQPVSGAKVRIAGSSLAAETDREGKYRVPYVPGQIRVVVERAGYDSLKFELQLTTPATYPVEDKTIVKDPPGPGVYYADKSDWSKLAQCAVVQTKKDSGCFDCQGDESAYAVAGATCKIVTDQEPLFLDATGAKRGLWLYRVDNDGTFLSIKRKGGFPGFLEQRDGHRDAGLKLGKGTIGADRTVYRGKLSPGIYTFVAKPWGPGRVVYPSDTCFMFELKTSEQVVQETKERQRLEREMAAMQSELEKHLASLSLDTSAEEWRALRNAAEKLDALDREPHAPRLKFNPTRKAAVAVANVARTAQREERWNDALLWATRALMLDGNNAAAKEIDREATYQQQANLAKGAFARQEWSETLEAVSRALSLQPDDQDLTALEQRASYEDATAKAKAEEQAGNMSSAYSKLKRAIAVRQKASNFDLSPEKVAHQDTHYASLTTRLAHNRMKKALEKQAPESYLIDGAVDMMQEAINLGADPAQFRKQYTNLLNVMHTPGAYLGRYMKKKNTYALPESEGDAASKRGGRTELTQIVPSSDGDAFFAIVRSSESLRGYYLLKRSIHDPRYRKTLSDAERIIGHDRSNNRIILRTNPSPWYTVYSANENDLEGLNKDRIRDMSWAPAGGTPKTAVATTDGTVLVLVAYANRGGLSSWRGDGTRVTVPGDMCAIAMSEDHTTLAIAKTDEHVYFYHDPDNFDLEKPTSSVDISDMDWDCRKAQLALSYNSKRLLAVPGKVNFYRSSTMSTENFRIISVPTGEKIFEHELLGWGDTWRSVFTTDPNLTKFVFVSYSADSPDGDLVSIDIDSSEQIGQSSIRVHEGAPTALSLLGDDNTLLVGFKDGSIDVYATNPPNLFKEGGEGTKAGTAPAAAASGPGNSAASDTTKNSTDGERLKREGSELMTKGDYLGALKAYRQSLLIQPDPTLAERVKTLEAYLTARGVEVPIDHGQPSHTRTHK